jgi:hypothetical protein
MNARLIEKATTLKTTKGESQNAFKRINQAKVSAIRLTHTGREVSPSGLKKSMLAHREEERWWWRPGPVAYAHRQRSVALRA